MSWRKQRDLTTIDRLDLYSSVYSPWYKNWNATVNENPLDYLDDAGTLEANDKKAREHPVLKKMFDHKVPKTIKGFELDKEDQKNMENLWPVGEDVPQQVRERGPSDSTLIR